MFVNKSIPPLKRIFASKLCIPKVSIPNIVTESSYKETPSVLYDGHVPTSVFQKILLTIGSSVYSVKDPSRHDMVAVLAETTGFQAAKKIRDRMLSDPEGAAILRDKPTVHSDTLDFDYLQSLPSGTFGQAYLSFLKDNNVTPDSRYPVQYVDDAELAYVIMRYRHCHDFFHTLLGMPTNMLGEVAVKWVEGMQTGLPMCVAGAIFGPVRFRTKQRQRYLKYYLPWAVKCGYQAGFLMNVYFEKRWEENISEMRKELNIPEFVMQG